MTPELDREFARLADERTHRHPWRTYAGVPLGRASTMWFWPRIELLPYSGPIFPIADEWDVDAPDLLTTLGFFALGFAYAGLALFGLWKARHGTIVWLPVAWLFVRTAFLTQVESPEPRYMLPAYCVVLALAAIGLARRRRQASDE